MLRGRCHANPVRMRFAGQENTRGIFTKKAPTRAQHIKNKTNTSKRNKQVKIQSKYQKERVLMVLVY